MCCSCHCLTKLFRRLPFWGSRQKVFCSWSYLINLKACLSIQLIPNNTAHPLSTPSVSFTQIIEMRLALALCLLLILISESYQCLANENSHEGVDLQDKDIHAPNKVSQSEEEGAEQRLSHTVRGGGRGGKNTGGGNSQVIRQPPSHRKSAASSLLLPYPCLVSMFFLGARVFF